MTHAVVRRVVPDELRVAPVHSKPCVAGQDATSLVQIDVQQCQPNLASCFQVGVRRASVSIVILKQVVSQPVDIGLVV